MRKINKFYCTKSSLPDHGGKSRAREKPCFCCSTKSDILFLFLSLTALSFCVWISLFNIQHQQHLYTSKPKKKIIKNERKRHERKEEEMNFVDCRNRKCRNDEMWYISEWISFSSRWLRFLMRASFFFDLLKLILKVREPS